MLEWDSSRFINFLNNTDADAVLVTINVVDPHYSYARYTPERIAVEVTEKEIVSNENVIEAYLGGK